MNRIKELRHDKGLSLKEAAELAGVSVSSFSAYERETRSPKIETWQKLSDALGVPVPYLQGLTDDPTLEGEATPYQKAIIEYLWWAGVSFDGVNDYLYKYLESIGVDSEAIESLHANNVATDDKYAGFDDSPTKNPEAFKVFCDAILPHISGVEAALRAWRFTINDIVEATDDAFNSIPDDNSVGGVVASYLQDAVYQVAKKNISGSTPGLDRMLDRLGDAEMEYRMSVVRLLKSGENTPSAIEIVNYKDARHNLENAFNDVENLAVKWLHES